MYRDPPTSWASHVAARVATAAVQPLLKRSDTRMTALAERISRSQNPKVRSQICRHQHELPPAQVIDMQPEHIVESINRWRVLRHPHNRANRLISNLPIIGVAMITSRPRDLQRPSTRQKSDEF
ncbi:hypothetical protein A5647_14285 [Mycobacterium sp. 1100029.7]|nr:hypothetical protein A5647_14285 [Mycobacterium sp. 1100029.7]